MNARLGRRFAQHFDEIHSRLVALIDSGQLALGEVSSQVTQRSAFSNGCHSHSDWAESLCWLWLQECQLIGQSTLPAGVSAALQSAHADLMKEVSRLSCNWDDNYQRLVQLRSPQRRQKHGVYVTPLAVVRFIRASVERLLEQHFGFRDFRSAVASDRLSVVDPACGTGVFHADLLECLLAQSTFSDRQALAEWYRRRCRNFEIDGIASTLAEARLQLLLNDGTDAAPVTLACNPLLDQNDVHESLETCWSTDDPILAVIGNPPYGSFGRNNQGPWIDRLLDEYRTGLSERKVNLTDDYIKFIRWSQHWVEKCGQGIVAMITNHGFIRGLTHRQMRASLAETFDHLYLLDLNGNNLRREIDDEIGDENLFRIQQGVAISFFVKSPARTTPRIFHHQVRGTRIEKTEFLDQSNVTTIPWHEVAQTSREVSFAPSAVAATRYRKYPSLIDLFPTYVSGVQTKNDGVLVAFNEDRLLEQVSNSIVGDSNPPGTTAVFDATQVQPYIVAPWDRRVVYYDQQLVGRSRFAVMRHMLRKNIGLVFVRQSTCARYSHFLAVENLISDRMFYSAHGTPYLAPLWIYGDNGMQPNLKSDVCQMILQNCRVDYDELARSAGTHRAQSPRDIFNYVYGVVHSPTYRQRYYADLSRDFPRIPIPNTREQYFTLRDLGASLVDSHLRAGGSASPGDVPPDSAATGPKPKLYPRFVEKCSGEGSLFVGDNEMARILREEWEFELGGYQVLRKWLAGRKRRPLALDEEKCLHELIATIRQTQGLVARIDEIAADLV